MSFEVGSDVVRKDYDIVSIPAGAKGVVLKNDGYQVQIDWTGRFISEYSLSTIHWYVEQPSTASKAGMRCVNFKACSVFNAFAEPNQKDGTYKCFDCRNN